MDLRCSEGRGLVAGEAEEQLPLEFQPSEKFSFCPKILFQKYKIWG